MCPLYGIARCPYFRGFQSMGIYGSVFGTARRCPLREVSLYTKCFVYVFCIVTEPTHANLKAKMDYRPTCRHSPVLKL